MKLFLFRISLKHYQQLAFFPRRQRDGSAHTRETWLKERLSSQITFIHRGNTFYFVPKSSEAGFPPEIIAGWIARPHAVNERTPPWDGLSTTEHQSWRASLILIDPRHHDDGQKIAMETRPDVGDPSSVLPSFAQALSPNVEEPFSVTIFPILQGRSFAEFASEHSKTIKAITYEASVPNMFGGADEFTQEMTKLRDQGNISKIKARLESDGVINVQSSRLTEIASHVERGGGKIKAVTTDGDRYNSDDHIASTDIDTSGTQPEETGFWQKVYDALDRIF